MENNTTSTRFHISLPCKDLETTKDFYIHQLGFSCGRTSHSWADVNLMGNQITFYQSKKTIDFSGYYQLDQKRLPIFHLGVILDRETWKNQLKKHITKNYMEIEPTMFLKDKTGEHDSFFIKDPNNYYLEFKTFKNNNEIFDQ